MSTNWQPISFNMIQIEYGSSQVFFFCIWNANFLKYLHLKQKMYGRHENISRKFQNILAKPSKIKENYQFGIENRENFRLRRAKIINLSMEIDQIWWIWDKFRARRARIFFGTKKFAFRENK